MVSEDKKRKHHLTDRDWGYGGVKRRDFRHSKDGPEVTSGHKPKRSKFCKRNGYKPHEVRIVYKNSWWYVHTCVHCCKEFFRYQVPSRHVIYFTQPRVDETESSV